MNTKYLDTLVMGCSVVGILNWMLAKVVESPIGQKARLMLTNFKAARYVVNKCSANSA